MNASLLIIGTAAEVILGYALRFFFSHRNTFQIAVGLSDIENTLRSVNGMLNPESDSEKSFDVESTVVNTFTGAVRRICRQGQQAVWLWNTRADFRSRGL